MPLYEIVIMILLIASLIFLKIRNNKVCMLLTAIALCIFAVEKLSDAVPMYLLATSGVMTVGEMFAVAIVDLLPIILFIATLVCLHKRMNKASVWLIAILLFVFVAGNWNTWLELIFRIREGF